LSTAEERRMDQRAAETSGPLGLLGATRAGRSEARGDAASLLARQPWARVSKELALYALVAQEAGAAAERSKRALELARAATERACAPGAPPWNPGETNLWTVLTGIVDELLPEDLARGPGASPRAVERQRIPLLDNGALDAELRARGLDPDALAGEGVALRRELGARAASPAAKPMSAPPLRRPELPGVSTTGWIALVGVVLATVVMVALAVFWARRT